MARKGYIDNRRYTPHIAMTFEWDEQKRWANLAKHLWRSDTRVSRHAARLRRTRVGAYGEAGGIVRFVVYTRRGEAHRLISARKAGTDERQGYFARIAAAGSDEEGRN